MIVDGGMLSNYPIWLFDSDGVPSGRPSGCCSWSRSRACRSGSGCRSRSRPGKGPGAVIDYVKALAQTMMEAHDRLYVKDANYARTIPIPTLNVRTTEFSLTKERALALFDSRHWAAEQFLDT